MHARIFFVLPSRGSYKGAFKIAKDDAGVVRGIRIEPFSELPDFRSES